MAEFAVCSLAMEALTVVGEGFSLISGFLDACFFPSPYLSFQLYIEINFFNINIQGFFLIHLCS